MRKRKDARKTDNRSSHETRKNFFIVLTILFPFVMFTILELTLRLVNYGGNLELVVRKEVAGREVYSINRDVARRYFTGTETTIPEPSDDTFEIAKTKKTRRIFCLGESTMAGFPYEYNATAPSMLREQLTHLLPDYRIEVINLGLSAVGSFVTKDLFEMVLDYEPDLIIVYAGHNEFYGAYGVGSTIRIAGPPWLTDVMLKLLRFKIVLAMRDLYASFTSRRSRGPSANTTMMEQMVQEQSIALNSEPYRRALNIYRRNTELMIEEAHDSGIPIIFTAPVSSLRDQKPFQSLANPTATLEERRSWKMAQVTGDSLYGLGQHAESVPWYRKSLTHDSLYAGTWYRLGQALYQSGRYDEARAAFVSARDHDALRFRMSEEFASALREVCGSHHVPLARVDSVFMDSSPHGIIGHELILEHLHPNIEGYALMARTWTHTIATQGLLADKSEWRWNNEVDNEEYMRRAGVTRFDWTVGRIRVEYLRHRWPFEAARTAYEFTPTTEVDSIAQQYVGKKIWWQEARYALAARYIKRRDFEAARMEVLAVAKVIPFSFWPRLRFADCYLMEGKKEEAMKAYLDCIAIEDNPYARSKLALILIERSDFPEAITQLQSAFQLDATTNHKLPTDVAASNRYLLGYAYAQTQNMKEAKDQLHRALAINPNLLDAKELLERIE